MALMETENHADTIVYQFVSQIVYIYLCNKRIFKIQQIHNFYTYNSKQVMQCSICLQLPTNAVSQQCCGNTFCQQCLNNWIEVKNSCPLCATRIGNNNINKLSSMAQNNQFDDGFLMLETQIKDLSTKINFIQIRIADCREESKKMKSMFSASHMTFLDDQFQLLKQYQSAVDQAFLTQDRLGCVQYIQLTTQLLLGMQTALDNGSFKQSYMGMQEEYEDENYEFDCYDPQDYQDDQYYMYQQFQMQNSRKQYHKQKRSNKLTAAQQQQKNKSIL